MRLHKQWLHYLDKEPTTLPAVYAILEELMIESNDKNEKGAAWWNRNRWSSETDVIFPEEDYQLAALPKTALFREVGRRMAIHRPSDVNHRTGLVKWAGKTIDFSAVSNKQLLHHVALRMQDNE